MQRSLHHALDRDAIFRALSSFYGITTADGTPATLICDALIGSNDFITGKIILLDSGASAFETQGAIGFAADTITVNPAFSTPVLAGTGFYILTQQSLAVAIAAILAALGVPGANAAANVLMRDVVGNKADTAVFVPAATWSLMRYAKALINAGVAVYGTVVDGAPAVTDFDTSIVEATNNHFNGGLLLFLDGPNLGQSHLVDVYTGANGNVAFATSDQWTDIPVNGNAFIIIPTDGAYLKKMFTVAAAIQAQTDKLAGVAPSVGSTVANWNAAEANIISIGADNIRNKLHSLILDINALVGTVTIRLYMQVNGVERRCYQQAFTVAADGPGLWIVNGTVGVHEVLRVTAQSNNAADNGAAIAYDFMLEAM